MWRLYICESWERNKWVWFSPVEGIFILEHNSFPLFHTIHTSELFFYLNSELLLHEVPTKYHPLLNNLLLSYAHISLDICSWLTILGLHFTLPLKHLHNTHPRLCTRNIWRILLILRETLRRKEYCYPNLIKKIGFKTGSDKTVTELESTA